MSDSDKPITMRKRCHDALSARPGQWFNAFAVADALGGEDEIVAELQLLILVAEGRAERAFGRYGGTVYRVGSK